MKFQKISGNISTNIKSENRQIILQVGAWWEEEKNITKIDPQMINKNSVFWTKKKMNSLVTQYYFKNNIFTNNHGKFDLIMPKTDISISVFLPNYCPWNKIFDKDFAQNFITINLVPNESISHIPLKSLNNKSLVRKTISICDLTIPTQPDLPKQIIDTDSKISIEHIFPTHKYQLTIFDLENSLSYSYRGKILPEKSILLDHTYIKV